METLTKTADHPTFKNRVANLLNIIKKHLALNIAQ